MSKDFPINRVYNLIWASASSYHFRPPVIGEDLAGNYSFYMNIIIGLSIKYFTAERIESLFVIWQDSRSRDKYDILAVYILEAYLYKKELEERPHLKQLRRSYYEDFLADRFDLKRKDLALKQNLAYTLTMKRAHDVLGLSYNKLNKKELEIYQGLRLPEDLIEDDLNQIVLGLFEKYLAYKKDPKTKKSLLYKLPTLKPTFSYRLDGPGSRLTKGEGSSSFILKLIARYKKIKEDEIEDLFGQRYFSKDKTQKLNEEICRDKHKKSRVYFSTGRPKKSHHKIKDLNQKALDKNLSFYEKNKASYERMSKSLSKKISSSITSLTTYEEDLSPRGNLRTDLAWKSQIPNYRYIFSKKSLRDKPDFRIDLLLDGSASLMDKQEEIAIETYILAKALDNNGIRSRIISYHSLGHVTGLTILKDYNKKAQLKKILTYKTMGFNRDGLAYRALSKLIESPSKNHLVLIFTDAAPSDIKPLIKKGLNKPYSDKYSLEDAKEELNQLRKLKVAVGGLIHKNNPDEAGYLFYNNFIQVTSIDQLANRAGNFIKKELTKTRS
ncbi:MAG: hypothetical protein Q4D88_05875 [Anaerococcus sp.]|nr:hypothetical protein [Anaerococcus sp.]